MNSVETFLARWCVAVVVTVILYLVFSLTELHALLVLSGILFFSYFVIDRVRESPTWDNDGDINYRVPSRPVISELPDNWAGLKSTLSLSPDENMRISHYDLLGARQPISSEFTINQPKKWLVKISNTQLCLTETAPNKLRRWIHRNLLGITWEKL